MRTYFNPEMNIASFDKEAVATTASAAIVNWKTEQSETARYKAEVDFQTMAAVDVQF